MPSDDGARRDILCMGEAMATFVSIPGASSSDSFRLTVAGAESNLAIHLAQRGWAAEWAGAVGDDPLGRHVVSALEAEGVLVDRVAVSSTHRTGVMVKHIEDGTTDVRYYRDNSAASALRAEHFRNRLMSQYEVVHLTGITAALSTGCRRLVDRLLRQAREADCTITFDVNHRPRLWPSPEEAAAVIGGQADSADVVFIGRDEAQELWGVTSAGALRDILPSPEWLVLKDGARCAHAIPRDAGGAVCVPTSPAAVTDPVGAGDAFAAGYVHGLLRGADIRECLALGHEVAREILGVSGDYIPSDTRGDINDS